MPNKTSMPALLAAVDLIGLCVQRATHSAADLRQKVHELWSFFKETDKKSCT